MTLHLIKLAVGAADLADVARFQAERLRTHGHVFHLTRSVPKRADELTAGGSIYWVIRGAIRGRQRIDEVVAAQDDEGRRQCRLILDPGLVAVAAVPWKAFQGWRYLAPDAAPADRGVDEDEPPPEMAAELRRLGLI